MKIAFELETMSPVRIAYVRKKGAYGPGNQQAMQQLKDWARNHHLLNEEAIILGIPQDDPRITPSEECRYDACIVTDQKIGSEDPVREGAFEGGVYAVFCIPHTAEAVQTAWSAVFPALQKAGYRVDDKPAVERYKGILLQNGWCELCVPIAAAQNREQFVEAASPAPAERTNITV
ncbi:AraC family transcriptional regulator [Saccharibacillus kuerlensis]|uniref:DNA gyrase inhibitor n=1 Tax=Saccharibacillus kuerlensis TaxID=459527 RepID=A0ABQ2L1B0_9BACL|nr:GyrI-like domain-containing protein [Saccharibacillus kuerlensis]GGN99035.1 DNA gyrase inhibitor [Saccharibacillus kuerlensis]